VGPCKATFLFEVNAVPQLKKYTMHWSWLLYNFSLHRRICGFCFAAAVACACCPLLLLLLWPAVLPVCRGPWVGPSPGVWIAGAVAVARSAVAFVAVFAPAFVQCIAIGDWY